MVFISRAPIIAAAVPTDKDQSAVFTSGVGLRLTLRSAHLFTATTVFA
jgi:hypothetical protein